MGLEARGIVYQKRIRRFENATERLKYLLFLRDNSMASRRLCDAKDRHELFIRLFDTRLIWKIAGIFGRNSMKTRAFVNLQDLGCLIKKIAFFVARLVGWESLIWDTRAR